MQLVLITPPTTAAAELHTVNRLFQAGLPALHVRKPGADAEAVRGYLQQIQPQYLRRVVLHQHHELAAEFQLKGIHYKEKDRLSPPIPRAVPGLSQSTSLHSIPEVLQDWQQLDYAFLSPVFDSISKQGYTAAGFDEAQLADALQRAQMPVYALGGVTPERVPGARRLGFAGVGVLGAVWAHDDPVAAMLEFHRSCLAQA